MTILVVYAHHEPSSFTASMKNLAVQELSAQGHNVIVSDLYAQGFSAVAQKWDFVTTTGKHFNYMLEQKHAAELDMSFAPDIVGELQKLAEAELLLVVAPLWWFSVPALLKGWFDRVLAKGVVWDEGRTYQDGLLRGKQAMLAVCAGDPADDYRDQGRHHANLAQVLHPVNYGTLAYCGFDVHEPFVAAGLNRADPAQLQQLLDELHFRLKNILTSPNWLVKH